MKRIALLLGLTLLTITSVGCTQKTAKESVDDQLQNVYPLNEKERALADANAKKYFEKPWPVQDAEPKQGTFINCRPSDSNKNGLVSCNGYVVNTRGQLVEKTVYAGYRPELVGVSNEDTVK